MSGDSYLSRQDILLWELIYSTMMKFSCLTVFRKTGPFPPSFKDCHIHFFVPRYHPRSEEVKAYLEHEAKSLIKVKRQREEDWNPNTHVKVFLYSGLHSYIDRDTREEVTEIMHTSFLESLKEEVEETDTHYE